jgi:hypothetical protein
VLYRRFGSSSDVSDGSSRKPLHLERAHVGVF